MFLRTIVLTLVISSKVDITPSVPIPLCFQPPNGISKERKKLAPFITAPPASIALATLNALFWSFENTQLESPKTELLAISMASSSVSNPMIGNDWSEDFHVLGYICSLRNIYDNGRFIESTVSLASQDNLASLFYCEQQLPFLP